MKNAKTENETSQQHLMLMHSGIKSSARQSKITLRLIRFCFSGHSCSIRLGAMKNARAALLIILLASLTARAQTESLDKLADDFWTWRAKYAPFTGDDVNRIERPGGTRDWSRAKIDNHRKNLREFEAR